MPKPRLLGAKPLMIGGKVALSDDCCCGGNTGACCDPACNCTVTTKADCDAIGGAWTSGRTCDPNPCVICPPVDTATVTVTFEGITPCPDFDCPCELNGVFVLTPTGDPIFPWAADFCFDGETFLRNIRVSCAGAQLVVADSVCGSQSFASASLCPPTVTNFITAENCGDGFAGYGGTATITW